jgi:hypothetical protein
VQVAFERLRDDTVQTRAPLFRKEDGLTMQLSAGTDVETSRKRLLGFSPHFLAEGKIITDISREFSRENEN